MGINLAVLSLLCASGVGAGQAVVVYESRANAREYHGAYQEPLRTWLTQQDTEFTVIGDEVAADPEALSSYPLLLTSSTYLVPDEAAAGIADYVHRGGRLIWLDSPARCRHEGLWQALGLASGVTYAPLQDCAITLSADRHPAALSAGSYALRRMVGNWAVGVREEAEVLCLASGTNQRGDSASFPAVVLSRYGEGRALTYNWVVWLNREPEVRALLADGLAYLLADAELEQADLAVRCSVADHDVLQPVPVRAVCRAYRRGRAGETALECAGELIRADGVVVAAEQHARLEWTHKDGETLAGIAEMEVPTDGAADGAYTVRFRVGGGGLEGTREVGVVLRGERWAEMQRQQHERRELLEPTLVGTLGDYDAEPRTSEGRVDIPRLMEQIATAHMSMYDWLIWHAETDWADLHAFLPLAREAGVKVWVTLCPPSEQGGGFPYSEPYRLDFIRWADEIGKLSQEHDNLVAVVIDDFWSGGNGELFTPQYIQRLVETLRGLNPSVAFLPTIYSSTVGDGEWIEKYGPLIDGIVYPYCEYVTGEKLEAELAACREWLGADKLLLVNVYAQGSGGERDVPDRTEAYMRATLTVSREQADGIRVYCLPKGKLLEDPRYAVTAELYRQWRAEAAVDE